MSESTTQSATQLASQYSVQVTDDLERNVKEQERVSAELTALQQQLAALQHDHALLVSVQQALGIAAPEPATGAATVPAPRDSAPAEPATRGRSRGKKAATAPKRAAAPKPGVKQATKPSATKPAAKQAAKAGTKQAGKAATKAAAKPAAKKAPAPATTQPTLVELVRTHLVEASEPRSAAEVTTALGKAHAERNVKTTVVRTTLEGLVAKNLAQRTKQGSSVYYTATDAAAPKQKQDTASAEPSAQGGS
ncbi:BlaI/MecI/CopY family transcriptional regulator [Streptomyces sp. NBC_01723]|uniref:hypothetical protein n=1 Tax=unclassified Streptomyces TaxID=2593676 RepID=UPI00277D24E1|nr:MULTISPECIES: hypothetical protein [unclassified Streptomyces]MDQ0408180.1 cell division septum initiation protein DivIVA [Streptomyces sp. DSM 40167]